MSEFCNIVFQKLRSLSENTHISFLVCKSQPWIWGITLHGVQNIASDLGEDIPRSEYYAWNSGHVFPRSELYAWNLGHVFPGSELFVWNLRHVFPGSELFAWNLRHVFPRSELFPPDSGHINEISKRSAQNPEHVFTGHAFFFSQSRHTVFNLECLWLEPDIFEYDSRVWFRIWQSGPSDIGDLWRDGQPSDEQEPVQHQLFIRQKRQHPDP